MMIVEVFFRSSPINFSTPISSPPVNYANGFDVVSVEDDDQQQQHLVMSTERNSRYSKVDQRINRTR